MGWFNHQLEYYARVLEDTKQIPIASMYDIFTCIYHKKSTIHVGK